MREVALPSGAKMKINVAPFASSKGLYQALLRELGVIQIDDNFDFKYFLKDVFCKGFSSPEVEHWIWKCLEKSLYNDARFDNDTFEPVERRDDYMTVCVEVVKENVGPFLKSLYSYFKEAVAFEKSFQSIQ